jgi:ABC-type nitrate/sulfonate/bicarbonate transport system permease component
VPRAGKPEGKRSLCDGCYAVELNLQIPPILVFRHQNCVRAALGCDLTIIRHVIFPAALPNLMTGIRLGIAFGFRSFVGGEMIASTDGIGYQIFNAQQYFQSARIIVGMLSIGIVWLLLDRLVLRPIEQRTTMRWGLLREGIENT